MDPSGYSVCKAVASSCILMNSVCGSDFSTSLPTLIVIWLVHSSGCEVISHCDFGLHFPYD